MQAFTLLQLHTHLASSSSVAAHNTDVISSWICEIRIWDSTMPAIWKGEGYLTEVSTYTRLRAFLIRRDHTAYFMNKTYTFVGVFKY